MPETETASDYLTSGALLGDDGALIQSGYAFSQVRQYSRDAIKGKKPRIKEWDYYYFGDDRYAVALTVADNSYTSIGSVSVMDFEHLRFVTKSKKGFMSRGKLGLPSSCDSGDVLFEKGGVRIEFVNTDGKRKLSCEYSDFDEKNDFRCEIDLEPYDGDNITVAVPFNKRRQFFYGTKIISLHGNGWMTCGNKRVEFDNAYGGLDWGRGVWPRRSVWYRSSLSTEIDGKPFGFNLGYGFGKPLATENALFFDGKAHKIDNVKFEIPFTRGVPDYLKSWKITDDADRLNLTFFPMIERSDKMGAPWTSGRMHQVFGKFYGKATLNDGTTVDIDNKIGFAENAQKIW